MNERKKFENLVVETSVTFKEENANGRRLCGLMTINFRRKGN